jgi:hypothetical protein
VLVARAGDEWPLEQRRYFAQPYHSYHGSPARKDAEIPLIVSHPAKDAAAIRRIVGSSLDGSRAQWEIGRLLVDLRYGASAEPARSSTSASK